MGNGISDCSKELPCGAEAREEPEPLPYTAPLMIEFPPTFGENFIASIAEPLRIKADPIYGKEYLLCELNKCGDSYRSPWSNTYDPPLAAGGQLPTQDLRKLEINMNFGFEQYYEGGVASSYAMPIDLGIVVVLLLKKEQHTDTIKASWDTVHVFEVQELKPLPRAHYRLTSKTMLWLETSGEPNKMELGGSMSHQMQQDEEVNAIVPHMACFGRMIDEMENKIRNTCAMWFGQGRKLDLSEARILA